MIWYSCVVYSSVYGLCVVDEYAALHIHASVHALSMFVSGGGWRPRRETAGHIDSARDTRPIPHKKRTPLFFWRRPEADYTTAQSDGSSTDTRCAIILFCLMAHDGRESPLSRSHTTHRGGFQRTDGSWAIQSWDPPLSLGRLMSRGSQKLSPRSNYYTTNL